MKQQISGAASKAVRVPEVADTLEALTADARERFGINVEVASRLAQAVEHRVGDISVTHQTAVYGDQYDPRVLVSVLVTARVTFEVPATQARDPLYAPV